MNISVLTSCFIPQVLITEDDLPLNHYAETLHIARKENTTNW
jgi:hypothetical protein